MILDLYPRKSYFCTGEAISIEVLLDNIIGDYILKLQVFNLQELIYEEIRPIVKSDKKVILEFKLPVKEANLSGFGVEALLLKGEEAISSSSTAFDVLEDFKYAPRYGFLSDFESSELNDESDAAQLNKYHINAVQFYDWMYRHHKLLPPEDEFIDAMGRRLSLPVVKQKIGYVKSYGMKALGYGAVYGAEKEYYNEKKEQVYFKNDGKVINFIDFIYMMDINRESPWHNHIIREFSKAIDLGFDGIHMDQYGFPKEALARSKEGLKVRHLRDDFPKLIEDTRSYIEASGKEVNLIFNAVNNWPIDSVAKAPQDCMYIEVWSPNDTYEDLNKLIVNAKKYAPDKQVILAAYLKPFLEKEEEARKSAENGALLTMSTIFSSGGFHLLLGENNGVLTEAYYPQYARLDSESFIKIMRNYYDFIVRYEELLFNFKLIDNTFTYTGGINGEYTFKNGNFSLKPESDKVWTQIKEMDGIKVINLINYTGINNMNWNEGKQQLPEELSNIEVTCLVVEKVKEVYFASPDFDNCMSRKIDFKYVEHDQGKAIQFIVPKLHIWDIVYIMVG